MGHRSTDISKVVADSGVVRGRGQVGARALRAHSTLFAVILNVYLSRNLDQSMLKNAYFLEKTLKIVSASRGSALEPPRCYSRLLLQLCRVRF